jgi:hypothetical protein
MVETPDSLAGVWALRQRVHPSRGPSAAEVSTSGFSGGVFEPALALASEVFSSTEQGYQPKRIRMRTDSTHKHHA